MFQQRRQKSTLELTEHLDVNILEKRLSTWPQIARLCLQWKSVKLASDGRLEEVEEHHFNRGKEKPTEWNSRGHRGRTMERDGWREHVKGEEVKKLHLSGQWSTNDFLIPFTLCSLSRTFVRLASGSVMLVIRYKLFSTCLAAARQIYSNTSRFNFFAVWQRRKRGSDFRWLISPPCWWWPKPLCFLSDISGTSTQAVLIVIRSSAVKNSRFSSFCSNIRIPAVFVLILLILRRLSFTSCDQPLCQSVHVLYESWMESATSLRCRAIIVLILFIDFM